MQLLASPPLQRAMSRLRETPHRRAIAFHHLCLVTRVAANAVLSVVVPAAVGAAHVLPALPVREAAPRTPRQLLRPRRTLLPAAARTEIIVSKTSAALPWHGRAVFFSMRCTPPRSGKNHSGVADHLAAVPGDIS